MFAKARLEQDAGPSFWSMDMSMVTTIVIVVSPLNALISNQIAHLYSSGIRASVLGVKKVFDEDTKNSFECDFCLCDEEKLRSGYYHIVFSHPESFISCKYGRELLKSKIYQDNICAIVIDEAHCMVIAKGDAREVGHTISDSSHYLACIMFIIIIIYFAPA